MKGSYSIHRIVSNIVLLPILSLFLISYNNVGVSSLAIDNFIQCLPTKSNPMIPISKAIFTPKNSSFSTVLQAYVRNSRFNLSSTPKPLAIVTALDVSHVQATVICAKAKGLEIRIRSGGHDYEGLSYVSQVPFVILDMFNLRSINIDLPKETAVVQAGATLGELYYKISKTSNVHGFPAGVCPTVGAGGHFGGGGYGTMIRKYGLSVDNIIDAQVVDANGRLLNRQSMGEDLFWAIRGAGAGSFAVVVSWTIKLVRVPNTVTVFNVKKTLEQGATNAVLQWQQVATKLDPNLFIRAESQVQFLPGGGKTVRVSFIALYLGQTTSLLSIVNQNFPLLGLRASDCIELPWVRSHLFWFGIPLTSPTEVLLQRTPTPSRSYSKNKSDYVITPIPRAGLETIWKKMIELENIILQWNPYGGRMSEIAADATPFPHRAGYLFKMQYISQWQDDSMQALIEQINKSRQLYATFTPFVSSNPRESFLNYRDIDIGTNMNGNLGFAVSYFKGNVPRLLRVKKMVDPGNFFDYEQSIPAF